MYCEKTSLATYEINKIKQNKCELNVNDYQWHAERTIILFFYSGPQPSSPTKALKLLQDCRVTCLGTAKLSYHDARLEVLLI